VKPRRRRTSWLLVLTAALIFIGLLFYAQRLQALLLPAGEFPPAIPSMKSATALRDIAQRLPEPQKFATLSRWNFENQDSLKIWEEKIFKGKTQFLVVNEEGGGYLSAQSRDACSGLYVKTNVVATPDLHLLWKWRVHEFPKKKNPGLLNNRAEDDFAARVYVIFLANNFFRSDVIEYVWDESLPVGTTAESPYSDRIQLMVIRSGASNAGDPETGGWMHEQRNVYDDYVALFKRKPKYPVGLVALMSDSDSTQSSASADFGEILLNRKDH
jgi:hypothetical protein